MLKPVLQGNGDKDKGSSENGWVCTRGADALYNISSQIIAHPFFFQLKNTSNERKNRLESGNLGAANVL